MMTPLRRTTDLPPLHVQVTQIIKEKIHSGVWRTGDVIPTEKELCTEFDVARGTVRQALHNLEAEGYLRREQGRGTFVSYGEARPEPAQANGSGRRKHLAFIVPYVRDSSVSSMFMGFQQVAESAGYSTSFSHVNNDAQVQAQTLERLHQEGVAGIALYPVDSEAVEPLDRFARSGAALVLVDRYLKRLSTDYVMTDHFSGAIRGVRYLLDQGHERVGFVTWLSPAVSMEHRHLGYQQALRERGITPDEALVCHVEGYPTIDLTPLREYLTRPTRPTAVFAANDQIAIALYRAAASVGLNVPRDLAVVGFDNLDISEQLDPPLTTIAQQFQEIGRKAAEVLLMRIGGDRRQAIQMTLSPDLIVRGSCLPQARREKVYSEDE
jgi:DNA-binding LacI/PurR family transcriptional regulator